MSRRGSNSGYYLKIIDGVNKGKFCFAYHKDQKEAPKGKTIITVEVPAKDQPALFDEAQKVVPKKFLINSSYLKICGFID